ncbi:MAG: peptidoglycan DD-metalloendopeptidase family protein [Conchiformibius sp.]|nr:peptidoglycan DD-metalloendopeptidase family protein [Conchiformibius sp.]
MMSVPVFLRLGAAWTLALLLAACADAPTSKTYVCRTLASNQYCVQSGDSLSRIAQRFRVEVSQLKAWNNLHNDNIRPGQTLTVARKGTVAAPVAKARPSAAPAPKTQNTSAPSGGFALQYPVRGDVVVPYGGSNKGIDIAAPRGTLVHAAADGTVIYSGSSVRGYGNLLLIRHNDSVITAYANNENLLVPDKAAVRAGQIVASVGDSGRTDGRTALHFEVRVNGKHVNPGLYLR